MRSDNDVANKDGTNALVSTIAQILPTLDGFEANQNTSIHTGGLIQTNTPARETLLANASIARKKHLKSIDLCMVSHTYQSMYGLNQSISNRCMVSHTLMPYGSRSGVTHM
jgi:hypothetical protein